VDIVLLLSGVVEEATPMGVVAHDVSRILKLEIIIKNLK
jgi:hypothetical protein